MKLMAIRHKAEIIGRMKILFDSRGIRAANSLDMVGDIAMDIQERYFVAIAAMICFVLISVGFLAFD
jgi:hypothetical protein